jgi:hypothetical protein
MVTANYLELTVCFKCRKTRIQRTNQSPTKTISIFFAVKQINKIPRKDRLRYEIRTLIFQYRSLRKDYITVLFKLFMLCFSILEIY